MNSPLIQTIPITDDWDIMPYSCQHYNYSAYAIKINITRSRKKPNFILHKITTMHILLIKLTSLGDVIHALPALTDAQRAIPNIRFDWVIDESFAAVANWHPAVDTIITTAHRRWRREKWRTLRNGELRTLIKNVRKKSYDYVIDGQNRLKSAAVTLFAKGYRCGLDAQSTHEYGAHWVYQKKVSVPKPRQENTITRMRLLFAKIFDYPMPDSDPDFAINTARFIKPALTLPTHYLFFIPNASWDNKLWPEKYWHELLHHATHAGHHVLLPAGNTIEYERAMRLAATHANVIALPRMSLAEIAYIIVKARAAVGVDTGLSHLAAALRIPTVHLYAPTAATLTGALFPEQIYLQTDFSCSPCYKRECHYQGASAEKPACYTTLPPTLVWQKLTESLTCKKHHCFNPL